MSWVGAKVSHIPPKQNILPNPTHSKGWEVICKRQFETRLHNCFIDYLLFIFSKHFITQPLHFSLFCITVFPHRHLITLMLKAPLQREKKKRRLVTPTSVFISRVCDKWQWAEGLFSKLGSVVFSWTIIKIVTKAGVSRDGQPRQKAWAAQCNKLEVDLQTAVCLEAWQMVCVKLALPLWRNDWSWIYPHPHTWTDIYHIAVSVSHIHTDTQIEETYLSLVHQKCQASDRA